VNSDLYVATLGQMFTHSISVMILDKKSNFSWKLISFGFKTTRAFLKTFEGSTRGRLGLLEKTSRLLGLQLEYIPTLGCFDYS
jgi:hypothetical protein